MTHGRSLIFSLLLAVPFLWPKPAPGDALPVHALIVNVKGQVRVIETAASRGTGEELHFAQPLDVLDSTQRVEMPTGSEIEVLCSTNHRKKMEGPSQWYLAPDLCQSGKRQPAGTFHSLVSEKGSWRSLQGEARPLLRTRNWDDLSVPILLAPRNTRLLQAPAKVVWTAVPGALFYKIEWAGASVASQPLLLEASRANCGAKPDLWGGLSVCSIPWPASLSLAGSTKAAFFVRVAAGRALGDLEGLEFESARAEWLPAQEREAVQKRLDELKVERDPFLREVARAAVFSEHGLHEEARRSLESALSLRDSPRLRVLLGDLYLAIDLSLPAWDSYCRGARSGDTATRQSAEAGLERARARLEEAGSIRGLSREICHRTRKEAP